MTESRALYSDQWCESELHVLVEKDEEKTVCALAVNGTKVHLTFMEIEDLIRVLTTVQTEMGVR